MQLGSTDRKRMRHFQMVCKAVDVDRSDASPWGPSDQACHKNSGGIAHWKRYQRLASGDALI